MINSKLKKNNEDEEMRLYAKLRALNNVRTAITDGGAGSSSSTTTTSTTTTPMTTTTTMATPTKSYLDENYELEKSQIESQKEKALIDSNILQNKIYKYLPEALKSSGLSGVGYNEQTLINVANNMANNRSTINSTYDTSLNELLKNYNTNKATESANLLNTYSSLISGDKTNDTDVINQFVQNGGSSTDTNTLKNYAESVHNKTTTTNNSNVVSTIKSDLDNNTYSVTTIQNMVDAINGDETQTNKEYLDLFKNFSDTDKQNVLAYLNNYISTNADTLSEDSLVNNSRVITNLSLGGILDNKHVDESETTNGDWIKLKTADNTTSFAVKISPNSRIEKTSVLGQKLLSKITSVTGESPKEGDIIAYNSSLYIVGNEGNLCKIIARSTATKQYENLVNSLK